MDTDEIDIAALFGVLLRHIKLIVATVILVLGAAFIYVSSLTPLYVASTLISVDPEIKDVLTTSEITPNFSVNEIRVDGEVAILTSDAVAIRVIEKANLLTDPEFGYAAEDLEGQGLAYDPDSEDVDGLYLLKSLVLSFRGATNVRRIPNTYLITASVRSVDPEHAADLTNIFAQSYIEHQISTKVEEVLRVGTILSSRIEQVGSELIAAETNFDEFITANLSAIERETGRTDLSERSAFIAAIDTQRLQTQLIAQRLNEDLQNRNWSGVAERLENDAVRELARQRERIAKSLETATTGSQASIDLRLELSIVEDSLESQTNDAISQLRSEVSSLQARVSKSKTALRSDVFDGDLPPEVLARMYALQQGSSIVRSQYDNLLFRLREVELQADLQVADSRIVSPALPPLAPSSPNKKSILSLAVVLALGLGVGLAFFYEFYIGGFTSEDQLRDVLRLRVATRLPLVKTSKYLQRDEALPSAAQFFVENPTSDYAESIRRLRITLDQALARKSQHTNSPAHARVIMLTSAVPGEGKSNTAFSLAREYATSGLRTLLIDCDLRVPRLHRILGVTPDSGMFQYLRDELPSTKLGDMYERDQESGLDILLGADPAKVPTSHLLVSRHFSSLLESVRGEFDVVVLDTPPVLPIVDSLYIAKYADIIGLVVKWSSTRQKVVRSILPSLIDAKNNDAEIVSVLNMQGKSNFNYTGEYNAY